MLTWYNSQRGDVPTCRRSDERKSGRSSTTNQLRLKPAKSLLINNNLRNVSSTCGGNNMDNLDDGGSEEEEAYHHFYYQQQQAQHQQQAQEQQQQKNMERDEEEEEEPRDRDGPQPSTSCGSSSRGSKKSSPNNPLISSTEKCKVCKEPAAKHIHYGSITCFSCRAFFRRSIQNKAAKVYSCKKQGNCEVGGLKSRKSCQKCRFDRCMEAGMKPSWVLSEEEKHRRFRKTREKKQKQKSGGEEPSESLENNYGKDSPESNYSTGAISMSPENPEQPCNRSLIQRPIAPPPPATMPSHFLPHSHSSGYGAGSSNTSFLPHNLVSSEGSSASYRMQQQQQQHQPYFHPMASGAIRHTILRYPPPPYMTAGPSTVGEGGRHQYYYPQNQNNRHYHRPEQNCDYTSRVKQEEDNYSDSEEDASSMYEDYNHPVALVTQPIVKMSDDEMFQIRKLCDDHDVQYQSVPFGEELIKEMVMCSVFGIPLSTTAAMTGYRLMIQRITKVAQAFDPFLDLPHSNQSSLLKLNADLLVSLRGAVFFEDKKKGLDQILYSMGVDDIDIGKKLITTALKSVGQMNRIDYKNFNSLQTIEAGNEKESRYDKLLARVGVTVAQRPEFVKILSYIILFGSDFAPLSTDRERVDSVQQMFVNMLKRLVYSLYDEKAAVVIFANLLAVIADLHELTHIKKQRALAPAKIVMASSVD